jgi:hypothetical protein
MCELEEKEVEGLQENSEAQEEFGTLSISNFY